MPTYLGWNVVTCPSTPSSPASFEFAFNSIVATSTNPFTGQQQIQDWNANFMESSVSLPNMDKATAADWVTFLKALKGTAGVFQFGTAVCAAFPESLTTDGTTRRYWRLKTNQGKWAIHLAQIYSITFEIREAI